MNLEQNHIIEKVFLEVNTRDSGKANYIKNNIDLLIKNELFPRLERLFGELDTSNKTVRFNSVDVNINVKDLENTEILIAELERKVTEKLRVEIDSLKMQDSTSDPKMEGVKQISRDKNRESTFLFFLENGYLPWHGKEEYINELAKNKNWKLSLNDDVFRFRLAEILRSESIVIERFILQFPSEIILSFLDKENHLVAANKIKFLKIFKVFKDNLRVSFLRFLIHVSLFDENEKWMPGLKRIYSTISENERQLDSFAGFPFVSEFKELIRKIISEKGAIDFAIFDTELALDQNIASVLTSKESDFRLQTEVLEQRFIEKETTEIAIQNAGLILLHPFIKRFFERLDLLDLNGRVKKEKLDLAVQSLHYLATGHEIFFEGNLVFEKFICGIPLKIPILKESLVTDDLKDEVQVLLNEAIKNWPALKNSSPNDLRQMFIHRDGKLFKNGKNYKLIVERKAQDVLLEKLNWNISIVKFPWKKELIIVEW